MGGRGPRVAATLCLNRVTARVRVRSPSIESKKSTPYASKDGELSSNAEKAKNSSSFSTSSGNDKVGRRVMIVVDSRPESKIALQWALSHTLQNHDTLLLLYVSKPSKQGSITGEEQAKEMDPRGYQLLSSMKNACLLKKPEVKVEIGMVEGKERGPTIVEEAKKQGVSLLVVGQRKRSITWRLLMMAWGARSGFTATIGDGTAEYCIQNAECMALAVRRKSRKLGGYLITTKRQKDFWLLA